MAHHKRKIPTLHYEITSYQTDFLPTYLVPISHGISIYEFLAIIMKSGSYLTRRFHHEVRKLPSKVIWASSSEVNDPSSYIPDLVLSTAMNT